MKNTKILWKLSIRIEGVRRYFYFTKYRLLQRFVSDHVITIVDDNDEYNCTSKIIITFGMWSTSSIKYIDTNYYEVSKRNKKRPLKFGEWINGVTND